MITVNAMGDACPIPVIKTKKAMQELTGAEIIEVLVDNEVAVQNVTKMAQSSGAVSVKSEKIEDKKYRVVIETEGYESSSVEESNAVFVFASDRMGEGNDELGKVLVKGFIFAVTQLDKLPRSMIFYNGGATLTAEGSDSIEDLKSLEAQGVEIVTCGTCLNYYGLTDKLLVGTVTNMYSIVEKLAQASKIIRP